MGFRNLDASCIYRELEKRGDNDTTLKRLLACIQDIYEEARQIHKTVIRYMPQYTLHDEEHILRVIELMEHLIPTSILQKLKPLELGSLILSACLHDIGMAPSEQEVRDILDKKSRSTERIQYLAFREGYPRIVMRRNELLQTSRCYEADELEAYLLSEYLRQTHGERARQFVFERYHDKFIYEGFNFTDRIAKACYSHTQDPSSIEELPCWELVRSPGEYVNWLFTALILRLADILDFDGKRTPAVLFEHLGIRDNISIREWQKHRSIRAWDIGLGRIAFTAKCPDPVIEKCVRDFIQKIEQELRFAHWSLKSMHDPACPDIRDKYNIDLPHEIDARNIGPVDGPEGPIYEYIDLEFRLDRESMLSLVMGINLYGDRLLFLRELLQNAVDACRHRKALHDTTPDVSEYTPRIVVELQCEDKILFGLCSQFEKYLESGDVSSEIRQEFGSKGSVLSNNAVVSIREPSREWTVVDNGQTYLIIKNGEKLNTYRKAWFLTVKDNGMGMDKEIVTKHFAQIGKSYYQSSRFLQEKFEAGIGFRPVSVFGVGVLSVFMVADLLRVYTRRLKDIYDFDDPIDIEINGYSGLFWFRKSTRKEPGTRLILELREDPSFLKKLPEHIDRIYIGSEMEEEEATIQETVKQLAPHVEFPIIVRDQGSEHEYKSDWELPDLREQQISLDLIRQIEIDLTCEAPDGLDGLARIMLLQNYQGNLSSEVELANEYSYCEILGTDLYNKLRQSFGQIEHVSVDYSGIESSEVESFSTLLHSILKFGQFWLIK